VLYSWLACNSAVHYVCDEKMGYVGMFKLVFLQTEI
jgi:hypothetical protein